MAAPTLSQAPGCPDSLEDFLKQVDKNREAWYNYVCEAANQNAYLSNENASLREQVMDLQEKETATRAELSEAQSIIRFQQKERETLSTRAIRAEIERDQALQKATQAVNASVTPPASTSTPAEITQDTLPRATAFIAPEPPEKSRLSEKIPDTDKFSGDSKDLNRFVNQIYQKLTVNRDRFRAPEERMAYVTSRLTGTAYAQVAPRIRFRKH
jgi:outer membrane translocation and assembly module TamA